MIGSPPASVMGRMRRSRSVRSPFRWPADGLLRVFLGDRHSFLSSPVLISATGYGLHGRGPNLRALLARSARRRGGRRAAAALAARRTVLAQVGHSPSVLAAAGAAVISSSARPLPREARH